MSWIPLTSPVALLLRVGAEGVSNLELVGALVTTLVFAAGALLASSVLLRRVAIFGGTFSLKSLTRSL